MGRKNGRSRRIFSKEENVQTLYIDKVFIHPDFQMLKSRIIHHDIGLYHLTSKAQLSPISSPVCLPPSLSVTPSSSTSTSSSTTKQSPSIGAEGAIYGWRRNLRERLDVTL